ncbi:MAG: hypothetical protein LBG80_10490, partial [Bacteroidales bacterium]|nr:hypothetical protein [Bacteroidales bacterium]
NFTVSCGIKAIPTSVKQTNAKIIENDETFFTNFLRLKVYAKLQKNGQLVKITKKLLFPSQDSPYFKF